MRARTGSKATRRKHGTLHRWIAVLAAVLLVAAGAQGVAAAVKHKSVGVSQDERKAYPDYSQKLVFSTYEGALLAGVKVTIADESGETVLSLDDAGPWLLADLPAGEYDVVAKSPDGKETSARVQVAAEGQTATVLSFTAPESD